nr:MAG TPA: Major head protein [Caudoviricetes sp.]
MRKTLPMNLQFFAEGGDGNGGQSAGGDNGQAGQQSGQNNQQTAGVDYDKIQAMLDNATAKKENAVLKSYFQQQGLSEEEVSQAIATFKQNKQQQVEQQQNANANLQNEVAAAQKVAEQAQIELEATKVAMTLGINAKTLPYVLKMADFSKVKGTDGKISEDNVKAALEQVLKDVPALKPATDSNGGFQIGGPGGGNTSQANEDALKRAFGL